MFAGLDAADKDPRKSLHVDEVPRPQLGPGEALVAVMASAINYNTVWTSIFEPMPTFAFLERYGRTAAAGPAARPALPRGRLGSRRRRAADRPGRQRLDCRRRGRRPLPVGRARVAGRARRHHARSGAAHLGVRDELRRAGRAGAGQGQPADAEARAPELGGGRLPRPGQLDRLPPAGIPQRRRHEARRRRPHLGRVGWARLVRHPAGARRRRDPRLRRVQPWQGRRLPRAWGPSSSSTATPRATGSGRTRHTQDPAEWRRFGARIRELTGGEDPDIVFEHPGRETFGASVYVARRGGTIVSCASTSDTCTSTTTGTYG